MPLFKTMGIMIKIVTFNDHLLCASCFASIIQFNPHNLTERQIFNYQGSKKEGCYVIHPVLLLVSRGIKNCIYIFIFLSP